MNELFKGKKALIVGGGIAGLEVANQLAETGVTVHLIEKTNVIGGHVSQWYQVFPDRDLADNIVNNLKNKTKSKVNFHFSTFITKSEKNKNDYIVELSDGESIVADTIILATGFDVFNAAIKEEYGYSIYHNVITSVELEKKLKNKSKILTTTSKEPENIAFIHCVGSRDEKVNHRYCSKVCCATAVKQAIELSEIFPNAQIFCFYMDLRMFDRYFEELYYEAQIKHKIKFIRGRLSEVAENQDETLVLKTEDTLSGKPLKLTIDMLVLMVGMEAPRDNEHIIKTLNLEKSTDSFLRNKDEHLNKNISNQEGIFLAGTCTGPKTISETIADARSAATEVMKYLNKQ